MQNCQKEQLGSVRVAFGGVWTCFSMSWLNMPQNIESTTNGSTFRDQLGKTSLVAGPGGLESHVYSPRGRVPDPAAVQDDLVSSQGLVRLLFQACWVTRTEAQRRCFRTKLENATTRVCVCQTIRAHQPLEIHLDEGRVPSWFVASTGLVSGFAAWVMNALAVYTSRSVCDFWEDTSMFYEGTLTSHLPNDQEGRVPASAIGRMLKHPSTTSLPLQPWPNITERGCNRTNIVHWPRQF